MKKSVIIFVLLVFLLAVFNKLLMDEYVKTSSLVDIQDLVNTEQMEAQKLFDRAWRTIKVNYVDSSMNEQDWGRWKRHYRSKIKTDEDADVAINTMISSLDDPYSRFLNQKDYQDQNTSIESKITGIGVNITSSSGKILVINVIDGTPAQRAKILPEDIILKINEKNVKGMPISDVASLVRGPVGTVVTLTILRDGKKLVKKIVRKEIKIQTVKSSMDRNIGYIQIMSFIGATTPKEFVDALEKTNDSEGLIIDLRGNTGGLLPNAIFIANMFIDEGNLVSIVGRNGYKKDIYAQETDFEIDKPLLVLIDGSSASASEILSGALRDYHKAKLLGTTSFGKGMVQKIIPMPNKTGLNLTIAKYLTPAGHDINKKGIDPDVVVNLTAQDVIKRRDVQLIKAKALMAQMIKEK